ncbi:hypothetical protein BY458DRAFT_590881 [Sporodiniella umbellata]|nr:hypothetical protein BY458DRAFT_590881 [Sporodiniella umbellata]
MGQFSCMSDQVAMIDCYRSLIVAYLSVAEQQRMSLLVHVNTFFCVLTVLEQAIVQWTFGELWTAEIQNLHSRALRTFFFKIILIGAIIDPVWNHLSMWVGILGFIKVFSSVSRDRLNHLTTLVFVSHQRRSKIAFYLIVVFLGNLMWYLGSFFFFPTSFTFLTLEFLPVLLDNVWILIDYTNQAWFGCIEYGLESQKGIMGFFDLSTDVLRLGCTFIQYLLLMWMHRLPFSIVDIVLLFNLKSASKTLYRKAQVYWEEWKIFASIRQKFADASPEELLILNDTCAICRENMKAGKKLVCGHVFHLIANAYFLGYNAIRQFLLVLPVVDRSPAHKKVYEKIKDKLPIILKF